MIGLQTVALYQNLKRGIELWEEGKTEEAAGEFGAAGVDAVGLTDTLKQIYKALGKRPPNDIRPRTGSNEEPAQPTPPAPVRTPAQIASDLIAEHGTSSRTISNAINSLSLPQAQVVEVMTEVYIQTGRIVAGTQTLPNGTVILLSRRIGSAQPVLGVTQGGQTVWGQATISMSPQPPFIIATDVVFTPN